MLFHYEYFNLQYVLVCRYIKLHSLYIAFPVRTFTMRFNLLNHCDYKLKDFLSCLLAYVTANLMIYQLREPKGLWNRDTHEQHY